MMGYRLHLRWFGPGAQDSEMSAQLQHCSSDQLEKIEVLELSSSSNYDVLLGLRPDCGELNHFIVREET